MTIISKYSDCDVALSVLHLLYFKILQSGLVTFITFGFVNWIAFLRFCA